MAVELEVAVPPGGAGGQDIGVRFTADTGTDFQMRLCRLDVRAVGRDLVCLIDGAVRRTYAKAAVTNSFEDVGSVSLTGPDLCMADAAEWRNSSDEGRSPHSRRFRVRAVYEMLPGQSWVWGQAGLSSAAPMATKIVAEAQFSNGTTWTADHVFSVYSAAKPQHSDLYG